MTKLPRDLKGAGLVKVLKRFGFEETGRRGSHVRLTHPDGRWTQVAVHPKPIPPGTLRIILRQVELEVEEILRNL